MMLETDQQANLTAAQRTVRTASYHIDKAINNDDMREALRQAAVLLGELRTSALGPQKYYDLYLGVAEELTQLQLYFEEQSTKGRPYADLYELVQHTGNVLPRLYLLSAVGACFIKSGQVGSKEILRDLLEMCKGVQHPTRGLFLRSYLLKVCQNLLPDTGSSYEGADGGDIVDAMEFLLTNFTEMNKLWVRMGFQGSARDKEKREQERKHLSTLIGMNLTGLSRLEGLSFQLYKEVVLPRVLEQVVSCKDQLAQQFLMESIIACFPDDFHIGTLDTLLGALPQLEPGVTLAGVVGSLMDKLARYVADTPSVVDQLSSVDAFGKISAIASTALEQHPDMPASDLAALYNALLSFSGAVYPTKIEFVDTVLETCYKALSTRGPITEAKTERQIMQLLATPLDTYGVVVVLGLKHYINVLSLLQPARQRDTARKLAETVLLQDTSSRITTVEQVSTLLSILAPLVTDDEAAAGLDDADVADDASLVARMIHQLELSPSESTEYLDVQYDIIQTLFESFIKSGTARMRHTLPPLCFMMLKSVRNDQNKAERWYRLLHRAASMLAEIPASAELALEIFLAAAKSASSGDGGGNELMAYECFEQAFVLYEESIPDSKSQIRALHSIIGTLCQCRVFDGDNREALVHKASSYCAKLLKKSDQCLAVLAASHLYWQQPSEENVDDTIKKLVKDGASVLSTLKRALKIATAVQQQLSIATRKTEAASVPGHLFVEILNKYLFYFDAGVETVTVEAVQSMLELAANEVSSEACTEDEALQKYYKNTVSHVALKKQGGGRYDGLQV